jgi:hypothetical protein
MESIKITLCPACGACPSVEIDEKGVRIGEDYQVLPRMDSNHDKVI